jgi:hypothetical protein
MRKSVKKLEPFQALHITKSEASNQSLRIDIMSKRLIEQKITNTIPTQKYAHQ